MIEKIDSLEISGGYFSSPQKYSFFTTNIQLSIVYGKNGSGKTTISKAISSLEDTYDCKYYDSDNKLLNISTDKIFVFNEEFIKSQVQIKDEGLDAIVLIGDQVKYDIIIEEKKCELEKTISEREKKDEVLKTTYRSSSNPISPLYIINRIKEMLKEPNNWVSREEGLNGKRVNVTDNIINSIFEKRNPTSSDKDDAVKQYQQLVKIIENAQQGAINEKIDNLSVSDDFWSDIDDLLSKKIERPVTTDRDKLILSIYNERGKHFFDDINKTFSDKSRNICPFCFREISSDQKDTIFDDIKSALSDIAERHEKELKAKKYIVDELISKLDLIHTTADNLKEIYTEDYVDFDAYYRIIEQILANNSQQLDNKINAIYSPININNNNTYEHITKVNSALIKLEEDRIDFNNQVSKAQKNKNKASEISKDIAYWEFKDLYDSYKEAKSKSESLSNEIKSFDEKIKQIKNDISELNSKKQQIDLAEKEINNNLKYIFMCQDRLELEIENGTYYLRSKGKRVNPSSVSTGERNIIALCYFFSKILENQKSSDRYSNEYLLVVDDPVSSFDLENKIGILSYLNLKLSEVFKGNTNSKCIILSHDYQTFLDIEKIAKELNPKYNIASKSFELKNKELNHQGNNAEKNQYTLLMKEIYNYANNKSNILSDFTVGNSMRRLLEAYGTFVYKKGINDLASDEDIMNLCGKYKGFYQNYMFRLILNGESHYEEKIYSQDDLYFFNNLSQDKLRDTAMKIICFLYIINPDHVKHHLKDKGNSLGNFENQIKKWINAIPIGED